MKLDNRHRKLTLVGAGPGDPELITMKAIRVLQSADIVLYDALVAKEVLDLVPRSIPCVSVGKRAGRHSFSQDEINELILQSVETYGHVVRLKGGDPFVFGRATEEIEFAIKHGIETAVVPGITSAIAVPASLEIPVTARGVSESFWVITGTTMNGNVSGDVQLAAQSTATVIILMGLNKLEEIVSIFTRLGRSETPIAIIQNGTLPNEQSVVGTISTIADLVRQENINAPAVMIIGEVVKYARDLKRVVAQNSKLFNG